MAPSVHELEAVTNFLAFLNASPTPFHAVSNASLRLEGSGFKKIREEDEWDIKAGGKYYFTRNQNCLLAFTVPQKWKQGAGVSIVATHVDSPDLRIRPISKRSKVGYLQVGVETYGGGIWHSWFDRDLSIAGRVIIADKNRGFASKLIKLDRPIMRIPTLAIHLDRSVNDSFKFNQETEMVPILGLISSQLNQSFVDNKCADAKASEEGAPSIQNYHHPALLALISEELSVTPEEIHDFDLSLYDTQPSCLGGINNEFIFSSRLDNLYSSFCALEALCDSASSQSFLRLEGNVNCIALFNHEEVGSVSTSGAQSSLIPILLNRLSTTPGLLARSTARSFAISSDVGHAIHPNYTGKYEEKNRTEINGGIMLKTNTKQKYASDAISSFLVRKLVQKKGGRVQEFGARNDMPCGSTIGPMLSKAGIRTVDVGTAILSMHSIREMAGTHDVLHLIDLFSVLFEGFAKLDQELNVE